MGKIFYIIGKSASGKDCLYKHLLEKTELGLKELILYTTRPIRVGETNGKEYYFVDRTVLEQLRSAGKIIEERSYDTIHGVWTYFTANTGNLNLEAYNYVGIGTLESYEKLKAYYGMERITPIYLEVEDGVRLERALKREALQKEPKTEEVYRRFRADERDFSEANIEKAGIEKRFLNTDLNVCLKEVEDYIKGMI